MNSITKCTVFVKSEQVPQIKVHKYIFIATDNSAWTYNACFSHFLEMFNNGQMKPLILTNTDTAFDIY